MMAMKKCLKILAGVLIVISGAVYASADVTKLKLTINYDDISRPLSVIDSLVFGPILVSGVDIFYPIDIFYRGDIVASYYLNPGNSLSFTEPTVKETLSDLEGAIPRMIDYSHEPAGTWAPHNYQRSRSNTIDNYAGYWTTSKAIFAFGEPLPYLYNSKGWYMMNLYDGQIFTESYEALNGNMLTGIFSGYAAPARAIALIIQAYAAHGVVDYYGVCPLNDWRSGHMNRVRFQSGAEVYKQIFADLDEAIELMKRSQPSQSVLQQIEGTAAEKTISDWQWQRWVKFANSIKLRMAMNMVDYVDPDPVYGPDNKPFISKNIAEEAVNDEIGVLVAGDRDIAYVTFPDSHDCCLYYISNSWNDIRMNANLENILKHFKSPLLETWFDRNSYAIKDKAGNIAPGGIYGVRAGIMMEDTASPDKGGYGPFAALSPRQKNMDQPFLKRAECDFLRAEGALRGWNMGGSAKELYEAGIRQSLEEWGVEAAAITKYMNQAECPVVDYIDYYNHDNDIAGRVSVGVKWDESDSKELQLEKIISQKWIANFPMGAEAWTTYRRTGYPRLFPVTVNDLPGVDTEMQIRRLKFDESKMTAEELNQIIDLMGGSQTCGDRVFWDVNSATWVIGDDGQYIPDNHL